MAVLHPRADGPRRAVFDIGIAGPLAGLVVALPVLYLGLQGVPAAPPDSAQGMHAGMSVLFALMYQLAHGGSLAEAAGSVVALSPLALAGWIGLVVTALNLLPVGQLDGGHISYALFGRRYARTISIVTVLLMFALALTVWPGLLMWALMVTPAPFAGCCSIVPICEASLIRATHRLSLVRLG